MFWEIAGAHGICPEVHYPVPKSAQLAGGGWVHRVFRALAALGVQLFNPIPCPRSALFVRMGIQKRLVYDGTSGDHLWWDSGQMYLEIIHGGTLDKCTRVSPCPLCSPS